MRKKAGFAALSGLLAALALTLSLLEGMLPPLPGMPPGAKLGLSNVVMMYAAGTLGLPFAMALAVIKGGFALLTTGVTAEKDPGKPIPYGRLRGPCAQLRATADGFRADGTGSGRIRAGVDGGVGYNRPADRGGTEGKPSAA